MTYIDGELASTVRVHVIADEAASFARARCVPGRIDATSARAPASHYRPVAPRCACGHGEEISGIAVLRPPPAVDGGASFQRRLHRCELRDRTLGVLPQNVPGPDVVGPAQLSHGDRQGDLHGPGFRRRADGVEARYPSFRSTPAEREALFGEFSLSLGPCAATQGTAPARADVQPANA